MFKDRMTTNMDGVRTLRAGATWLAIAVIAVTALAGCDKLQATGEVPTYPDSKLDAMRIVTGADLPHDPHQHRAAASAPLPPAAGASAGAAAGPGG
jgi:hypothetical protein